MRVGVVEAWRCWRLLLDYDYHLTTKALNCWLLSHFQNVQWDGPVMVADAKPNKRNSNGLYAAKSPDAENLPCQSDLGDVRVLGRVGMYGKVVEGPNGYRAEQMIVQELWLIDTEIFADYDTRVPTKLVLAKLAERYQVEVHEGRPDDRR